MGFGVKMFGQWARAGQITSTMAERFKAASEKALLREGHYLRGQMVSNITGQGAPAGAPFAPLSAATMKIRKFRGFGGSKILMQTGALRGSITVARMAGGVFVGILRKGGKGKGGGRANIAEIHEFGATFTLPSTEKQRRFLQAALADAGAPSPGKGGGTIKVTIPARPFIGPVVDKFATPTLVRNRFWEFVSKAMGGDLGR